MALEKLTQDPFDVMRNGLNKIPVLGEIINGTVMNVLEGVTKDFANWLMEMGDLYPGGNNMDRWKYKQA